MKREHHFTESPYEESVGFSRAIRAGNQIHVAGTAAIGADGKAVAPGDPYRQAVFIFDRIRSAIEALGGSMNDVVRTRTFVTRAEYVKAASRAHGEMFRDIRPASTMVVVSGLVDPELLVEIEATAITD